MSTPAPWRPSREQVQQARDRSLRDVLAAGVRTVFCGINPSLYSAAVGHHFARPGNRFWPALHLAGFTDRLLSPFEDGTLPALGLGITNLVARATASASELTLDELRAGAAELERKVDRYGPRLVAFVGIDAYRLAFGRRRALPGPQPEHLGPARVWVLPNTSGLNASYQMPAIVDAFGALRRSEPGPEGDIRSQGG